MNHNSNKTVRVLVVILLVLSFAVIAYQLGSMNKGPDLPGADEVTQDDQMSENDVDDEDDENGNGNGGGLDLNGGDEEGEGVSCTKEYDPVCGKVDGKNENFGNLCLAEAAGAEDIEPGKCPLINDKGIGGELCPAILDPVCGTVDGKKQTFDNSCKAEAAGAENITPGKCSLTLPGNEIASCPNTNEPVCGMKDGKKVNYKNKCEAEKAGATQITDGQCSFDIKL